ncbi:GNAT family N-acetyltransferase [uncultured Sneathiella sp.]|uniref:GNAT family N-acetyltransferase n=1 Tax=uncultured Sneathiella sp. TaxID=879315 RepID=UPI0030EC753B|tara:strand:+ start:510 stop:956 length:447 start_codon:yes stop_codon:yes gene_type:complete
MIRCITFDEAYSHPDFADLLAGYGDECAINGLPAPDCQPEQYKALELTGAFHVFGAFSGDRMIGFLGLLISVIPHYGAMVATTESFFVDPDKRQSGAGIKLLRIAEAVAKDLGAVGLLVSAPFGGKLADVMEKVGYTETNRVFFRGLA